jgi:hypothetical protein
VDVPSPWTSAHAVFNATEWFARLDDAALAMLDTTRGPLGSPSLAGRPGLHYWPARSCRQRRSFACSSRPGPSLPRRYLAAQLLDLRLVGAEERLPEDGIEIFLGLSGDVPVVLEERLPQFCLTIHGEQAVE